jgi:3-dehydroquinate synthase
MMNIKIEASKCYAVTIGSGILHHIGETVLEVTKAEKVCIISDSNVWPIYGNTVRDALCREGFHAESFVFPAGESSKNGNTYLQALQFLADHTFSRRDCIIALGGGVVGDLAGFVAATYLRGIPYIQVPTTLLAMVDSSVGGKTAIDLPAGKNLCGAFYQPAAVLCDIDTLNTLPEEVFRDGCAEVIKYGILYDTSLVAHLVANGLSFDREAAIARCVELKRNVVAEDEFDNGNRMLLNLGHTIGHAVEKCSNYSISHGKAVAMGMAIVSRAAKCQDRDQIISLLTQFGLPTTADYAPEDLCRSALQDKKRNGNQVHLILPRTIGDCVIRPIPVEQLKSFIEEGL